MILSTLQIQILTILVVAVGEPHPAIGFPLIAWKEHRITALKTPDIEFQCLIPGKDRDIKVYWLQISILNSACISDQGG